MCVEGEGTFSAVTPASLTSQSTVHGLSMASSLVCQQAQVVIRCRDVASTYCRSNPLFGGTCGASE